MNATAYINGQPYDIGTAKKARFAGHLVIMIHHHSGLIHVLGPYDNAPLTLAKTIQRLNTANAGEQIESTDLFVKNAWGHLT